MISISFALSNPWAKPFDNMWNKAGQLTANKSWEVELTSGRELIGFEFGYTMRQSHAGLRFELTLLSYSLSFQIYDNRHWDCDNNRWEVYANTQTNN